MTKRQAIAAVVSCLTVLSGWTSAQQLEVATQLKGAAAKVARAHKLLNGYYGDGRLLEEATTLIESAIEQDPQSSDAYVEAARIVIKGGRVVSDTFRPGTLSGYRSLIDKALELNPKNVRAIALRAEASLVSGELEDGLAWTKRGLAIDPEFVWLKVRMANYYERKGEVSSALYAWQSIAEGPCRRDDDHQRACVMALSSEVRYLAVPGNEPLMRQLASQVEPLRDPADAWVLGDLCASFAGVGQYDDAIKYGRAALSVMNYGVGRTNLAVALYLKATQAKENGFDASPMVKEAQSLGVPRAAILRWFERAGKVAKPRKAAVENLLATH